MLCYTYTACFVLTKTVTSAIYLVSQELSQYTLSLGTHTWELNLINVIIMLHRSQNIVENIVTRLRAG